MRMRSVSMGLAFALLCFSISALAGCGGVGSTGDDIQPLRLLDVYPQQGETGVPLDAAVIAAFDDEVFAAGECQSSSNVSAATLYLRACPQGGQETQVTASVMCSRLYENDGVTVKREELTTALLQPDAPLEANARYCIYIDASIKGENTDQLGVTIESSFTTADH
ncbi:MAG TPA: Ig-like domain-containing protein [Myxococcota bacterium]|nr:Ig-like domain-containing protein [Myxococcota bacterium]